MRKLYINQSSLKTQESAVVRDEQRQSIYLLIGKWGIAADSISAYNMHGGLVAELKQLSTGLFPKFDLYAYQHKVGTVSKHIAFQNELTFVHGLNWVIVGNQLKGDYNIYHGLNLVMSVKSGEYNGSHNYKELVISEIEDEPVCVCLVAILDHWAHRNQPLKNRIASRLNPGTNLGQVQYRITSCSDEDHKK